MDVYGLLEKEDRRRNRGACPVCNTEMALVDIEGHVNQCLDRVLQTEDETMARSLARTGYHPLGSTGAATASTSPEAGADHKHSPSSILLALALMTDSRCRAREWSADADASRLTASSDNYELVRQLPPKSATFSSEDHAYASLLLQVPVSSGS